jgi:DNA-binding transcriptional regulator YiaG
MAKKFGELRAKMPPEAQARAAAKTEAMLLELELKSVRQARNVTQAEVARAMSVEQASISKLEHREDMYVSTLSQYIKALGGELKLIASFPEVEIPVHQYTGAIAKR